MATPRQPATVIPFVAVSYKSERPDKIVEKLGEIDEISEVFNLDRLTNYYKDEMGETLFKVIYSFKNKIVPDKVIDIKLQSYEIEKQTASDHRRTINIDPGYIDLPKIVLTSFKNFSHRIYLAKGVYAEVTMIYDKDMKSFKELPWTYPDYKTGPVLSFLNSKRRHLLSNKQL